MSEELLIRNCSPTLAGLKTGSMFNYTCASKEEMLKDVRTINDRLKDKGVIIVPISYKERRAYVYIYRPSSLKRDLENEQLREILITLGYPVDAPNKCLVKLMRRMRTNDSFPHEVGLFLGYPPEDVNGFINHKDIGCKTVGVWKVYGDVDKAKETFNTFRKCKNIYSKLWYKGRTLEQLTVAK